MKWEAAFRGILYDTLKSAGFKVEREVELSSGPMRLDLFAIPPTEIQIIFPGLNEIFGKYVKKAAIISLKSGADRFTVEELYKTLIYLLLMGIRERWDINGVKTATPILISSRTPRKFISTLKDNGIEIKKIEKKGVYYFKFRDWNFIMIVINELEEDPQRYLPLLLFATGKRLKSALKFLIKNRENPLYLKYLRLSYPLYYREIIKIAMKEGIDMAKLEFNVAEALEAYGLKKMVEEVGLKRVIDEFGLKRVIDEFGLKKVINEVGIKRVINEVGIKRVINEVGIKRVINEVGLEYIVKNSDQEKILKYIDPEVIKKWMEKNGDRKG